MSRLQEVLDELERVLSEERQALRVLDGAKIDETAARKSALEERLRELAAGQTIGTSERRALERVRSATRQNMVLLVHARTCVRGALAAARGCPEGTYPAARSSLGGNAPFRVDLRR